MPLIHCDYSETHLNVTQLKALVSELLNTTATIYGYSPEEAQDMISVLCRPFGLADHTTAAAEIEVRAKITEFDKPGMTREEARQKQMDEYKALLQQFIAREKLAAGLVFTITFEDWAVAWLPPADAA
jgi:hypothetical protein